MKRYLPILLALCMTACWEKTTSDARKTYRYWAGSNSPAGIELLHGQYWESAHWTKEYEMYLVLKAEKDWWNQFVADNDIDVDSTRWERPVDAPDWFVIPEGSIHYRMKSFDQGGGYFRDTISGICYIYEIQL